MKKIADSIENSTNGKPLQNAIVTMTISGIAQALYLENDAGGTAVYSVLTDEDGYYEFYIPDGVYDFNAAYGDISRTVEDFEVFDESEWRASIVSGTYTPAFDQTSNCTAAAQGVSIYTRIGDIVQVSGFATVDPTADATTTAFNIGLPIASVLVEDENACGVITTATVGQSGFISADPANSAARASFISATAASVTMAFQFTYRVL